MSSLLRNYHHQFNDASACTLPTGKVVCVGRNYAAHAKELNNPIPDQPIIFIKPSTSVVSFLEPIEVASNGPVCHYEAEIAVLIGEALKNADAEAIHNAIAGYGVGLDLTLRQLQTKLKQQGHPWELAKAFDGACPLTPFVAAKDVARAHCLGLRHRINQQVTQCGHVSDMLNPIIHLIEFISKSITLLPGDVVLTGTPAGVGALENGFEHELELLLFDDESHSGDSDVLLRYKSQVVIQ
ncbi:MAG: isomerase/hydrolase [Gammaproteobacteria bacterium]|nr:MAG: isomerase/hydrolase [Gammaproteobacteria bacterium]